MQNFNTRREAPLDGRVVRSGAWVIAGRILQQGVYLIRTIILARLLAPNDFGLFGIALLILSTIDTFSRTGFRHALIQKNEDTESYLNTAWSVEVIRGAVIACILFLAAPYAADFFRTQEALRLIRVMALVVLARGFINIAVIYFEKDLKFHKYFTYHAAGAIADLTVSIAAAFILRSAWALVWGRLAGALTRCIASYIVDPYRPKFKIDLAKAKELFDFGKWVFGASALIFLITQGDDIFVGKMIGITALGFYQMAYLISNLPVTEITHVISQVTFPAYSKIQDDLPRLRDAYLKVLKVVSILVFPVAALIFVMAPGFTRIFLGSKWMPMVPAMQALCIFGLARAVAATMGPVLYGAGRPKVQTRISLVQLILMVLIIYPLSMRWGILGTSIAVSIPSIIALIIMTVETKNIIKAGYAEFLARVMAPASGVLAILFSCAVRWSLLPGEVNIYGFFLEAITYSLIYTGVVFVWDRLTGGKIMEQVREITRGLAER